MNPFSTIPTSTQATDDVSELTEAELLSVGGGCAACGFGGFGMPQQGYPGAYPGFPPGYPAGQGFAPQGYPGFAQPSPYAQPFGGQAMPTFAGAPPPFPGASPYGI